MTTTDTVDNCIVTEKVKSKHKSKSCWFKQKILNNATKYTLNGVTSKTEKAYFPLSGAETNRFPNAGQLADHLNFCIQKSTKKESYGYDKDLKLGIKTIIHKDKNPDSCELPPGCYQYHVNPSTGEEGLVPFDIRSDSFVDMDGALEDTKKSIQKFLEKKEVYREKGLIYKLGVMMYGPPGAGKTSLLRHLIARELPEDAVVVFLSYLPANFLMKMGEALGDDVLKVLVFEEFTEIEDKLRRNSQTDVLLQFLDGEFSLENSIIFATTNFPEKIPENIVNRPGRFDKLMYFGNPSKSAIKKFISFFLDREVTDEEVTIVSGLSTAAIREVCLLQIIEGYTFLEAAKILKDRKSICANKFKSNNPGFKM